ncbi:peptidase M3 [Candidatus Marinamargulisbacteria bacterium SCGC AG-414-C22]|nr:peptidase M3 [Candidatus Marinamargulisbacteria bacterium SCGC AG-414-C22]
MIQTKESAQHIIWDLSDLFNDINDPEIKKICTESPVKAEKFAQKYKDKINTLSAKNLTKAFQEYEEILLNIYKLSQYSSLNSAIDTQCDDYKALRSTIDSLSSSVSNTLVFFSLEIAQLSKEHITHLDLTNSCKNYYYYITEQQKNVTYKLSEDAEKIATIKNISGKNGYKKLYSELVASFEFEFKIDGKIEKLNGTQLRNLRYHHDAKVRRSAMKTFYKRYEDNQLIILHIFNNLYKDFNSEREHRGYKTPISVRNIGNNLSEKAVDNLHNVTTESNSLVQRYYKIKAHILDLPDLSLADIYAPMPDSNTTFTYDEAKSIVLEGFKAFDDDFYSYAKAMFDENRIHAPVLPKKRGGAFCSGYTPDIKPYVMLNFMGKPRDVSTMAHELGHAIHDMFASKQTLINYHPILPLAETASVFSEMVITDLLLKKVSDNKTKQVILTEKLEDIFATSHRQNMFSCFEKDAHALATNQLPTIQDYCNIYKKQLKTMFGTAVKIPTEYQWEWSTIPHFIDFPFYVYAYNFGNLLVMALYQQYKEEGKAFIPKLKKCLAAGSVTDPKTITRYFDVDIEDPSFWRKSIVYIESLITELEQLVT